MGRYTAPPSVDVIVMPRDSGTRATILVSSALIGQTEMIPMGHLPIPLGVGDLVGMTPAQATLTVLRQVVSSLERIVAGQGLAEPPASPDGDRRGEIVNVPIPGLEPSTLT